MRLHTWIVVLLTALPMIAAAGISRGQVPPEPGPDNEGLRLRLVVATEVREGKEIYDVRLDLINTTEAPITVMADWPHDGDEGTVQDYLEAAASIETFPPIAPWEGQTTPMRRTSAQPSQVLGPKGTLSVRWKATDRRLKNRVTDPQEVQNPRFPSDGLYAVHAMVVVRTPAGPRLLRSNEQQVPVGGSQAMPKHALGKLFGVDGEARVARMSLGRLHGIEVGDAFLIRTGMVEFWRLTVRAVEERLASGDLAPADAWGREIPGAAPRLPQAGAPAKLIAEEPKPAGPAGG